jgi:hypothetical protein
MGLMLGSDVAGKITGQFEKNDGEGRRSEARKAG